MTEGITRKTLIGAGVAAVGAGAGYGIYTAAKGPEAKLASSVTAKRVGGPTPGEDPGASAWGDAEAIKVRLLPQQAAPPTLDTLGVGEVVVRALHDGTNLALRVSWEDDEDDNLVGLARFQDAMAIQIPAAQGADPPSITMGGKDRAVHVLQWRATWQRDIDEGRAGVEAHFPRVIHDVTPDEILDPKTAGLYYPARNVGNPMSALERTSPIEEAVAEGFGSLTTLERQVAVGRGEHKDGKWRVAVGLPLARGGPAEPLAPGSSWPIAFAVWLGSRGNRGSRKQYADWISLRLEP